MIRIACCFLFFLPCALAPVPGAAAKPKVNLANSVKVSNLKAPTLNTKQAYEPNDFLNARLRTLRDEIASRPPRTLNPPILVKTAKTSASKTSWLREIYERRIVEASSANVLLADKLVMYEILRFYLGDEKVALYHPKTIGLKQFLVQTGLVDTNGHLLKDGDRFDAALHEMFPAGFVVRPAVGIAPQERSLGLFAGDTDKFIIELLKEDTALFRPEHMHGPVKSHILGTVASGEAVVLQSNVVMEADAKHPLHTKLFRKMRVHTHENKIVADSVPTRWTGHHDFSEAEITTAEKFVQQWLTELPQRFVTRQAWGVDVAVLDNGTLKILDIVTNRGQKIGWSSYLDQPRILGAYTRHIESQYALRFNGWSGILLRRNLGNYWNYWDKRIERAPPGMAKALAYFPPLP